MLALMRQSVSTRVSTLGNRLRLTTLILDLFLHGKPHIIHIINAGKQLIDIFTTV